LPYIWVGWALIVAALGLLSAQLASASRTLSRLAPKNLP
jgi:hypothetical protein